MQKPQTLPCWSRLLKDSPASFWYGQRQPFESLDIRPRSLVSLKFKRNFVYQCSDIRFCHVSFTREACFSVMNCLFRVVRRPFSFLLILPRCGNIRAMVLSVDRTLGSLTVRVAYRPGKRPKSYFELLLLWWISLAASLCYSRFVSSSCPAYPRSNKMVCVWVSPREMWYLSCSSSRSVQVKEIRAWFLN